VVAWGDFDGADATAEKAVGDIFPGTATVLRTPHTTSSGPEVEEIGLACYPSYGCGTPSPERADVSPLKGAEKGFIHSRSLDIIWL